MGRGGRRLLRLRLVLVLVLVHLHLHLLLGVWQPITATSAGNACFLLSST